MKNLAKKLSFLIVFIVFLLPVTGASGDIEGELNLKDHVEELTSLDSILKMDFFRKRRHDRLYRHRIGQQP